VNSSIKDELARIGRGFNQRGWVLGTSGNFSAVLSRNPLRLAITSSGIDKEELSEKHILEIDDAGKVINGEGRASAETLLHLSVVRFKTASSVLHTHSAWSNILSDAYFADGGLNIEGFEMLKGLDGISTHEHREWVPIVDNSQDMKALSNDVERVLSTHSNAHGFLIRKHGLYTWGRNISEAKRHVEIFEFLFEVLGRRHCAAR